ncbi:MAG: energy-coupling factor transporter transmembrane protein EcfT [Clostridia bacterium]|nr:energy-coupling factor transporter transmembrane protein EcfT [Clostridia bacterium]
MKEITIGQYYPVKSPVHSLDPRTKILCAIFIIAFTFVSKTFIGLGISLAFVIGISLISRIPLSKLLSSLKAIWFILVFTFVLNVFFLKSGTVIWEWKFISITSGGLIRAVFMAIRLMLLIVSAGLLTLTTSPIELTDGLERLLSPFKKIGFPAHEIAMMMSIALRFIPILSEETDKIMKAQSARGAVFDEGSLIKRARAITALLVPLLASAFHRALELASAMEARCYHGGEGRTRLKVLKMKKGDGIAFSVIAVFIALILLDSIYLSKILPFLVG